MAAESSMPTDVSLPERIVATGTDTVHIAVRDRVAVITLNRPERRNALHHEMYAPINHALEQFASDHDVGCIVLTGAGSGFCAGGDVRDGRRPGAYGTTTAAERSASLLADAQVARALHEHPKITIAAVNGAAVGAGFSLALACDLRIAASSARFIAGWIDLGLAGDFGGAWFLTRLVGPAKAIEILATNTTVNAEMALAMGIVNRAVDDETFPNAWWTFARSLAHGPTYALTAIKANVRDAHLRPLADALVNESHRNVESSLQPEHRAAVRAWMERRRR